MSLQRPQGAGREIRTGIDQLKTAVQSGDLEAARSAYDSLSALQSKRTAGGSAATAASSTGSSTGSAADRKDPLSTLLETVGAALETGDIAQVRQAFEAAGPKGGPGGRGAPPPDGGGRGGAGGPPPDGPSDEMRAAMGSLAQSLQSGTLEDAQSAYSSLADLLGIGDGSSTSGAAAGSRGNPFLSALAGLGSALQSGDLGAAQQQFASVAPRGSQGVDIRA
ncbi:hypothetical protein [Azospirillum thermophilum]|uniref:Uncharacterized protein n=1 Tax=Azospirillum thermophilum TaxID=2202148 RepID=A0A2S2CSH5_9PROT|nr:hypothetical protein [Azospirillum thermophilum]AWK87442.1 hypothetical protein DEW08_15515 [Azospirillum thermophilum]